AWAEACVPDLTLVTGDLLSRARGEEQLRRVVSRLPHCFAILGNHDLAESRDPFSEPVRLQRLDGAELLFDEGREVELRGRRVWVAGVDAASRGREPDLSRDADLSILLTHFP